MCGLVVERTGCLHQHCQHNVDSFGGLFKQNFPKNKLLTALIKTFVLMNTKIALMKIKSVKQINCINAFMFYAVETKRFYYLILEKLKQAILSIFSPLFFCFCLFYCL